MSNPSLNIKTLSLSEMQTNCYIVSDPKSGQGLVIDPADSGDLISQTILEDKITLTAVVLTHGHFDHVMGLLELKLNFSEVPIFIHQADLFLVKEAQKSAQYWLKRQIDPVPLPNLTLDEKSEFSLGDQTIKVAHTPGHTPGSICLYTDALLFTGDSIFSDGVGRTDFRYSSPAQLNESIKNLKINFPKETRCYPGHGEDFLMKDFLV